MLLMSMLSLPQMIAEVFCNRFKSMMLLSVLVSLLCCLGGLFMATVVDVPCSALIVLTMTAAYMAVRLLQSHSRLRTAGGAPYLTAPLSGAF